MGLFGISDFFGGGEKLKQPYQPPPNIQQIMQPVPVTEMQKTALYDSLVNAKQGYENANKAVNYWNKRLETPDLTDEERKKFTGQVQSWTKERDTSAQNANMLFNTATNLGLDVSDYGKDKSLQEAQQNLANYRSVGVKNFLNLPSMVELEDNRYRELRSQGASPGQANRILNRERGQMRDLLSRQYTDALVTYGTNPDGSLDQDIGMQLIGRAVSSGVPQIAQLFVTEFASPQKVFDANRAQALSLLNNDATMARQQNANEFNRMNSEANRQLSWDETVANIKAGDRRLEATLKAKAEEGQLNRELNEKLAWLKSAGGGDKMTQEIMSLANLFGYNREGATDEEKQKIWNKAANEWLKKNYPKAYNQSLEELQNWAEVAKGLGMSQDEAKEFILSKAGYKPLETSKNEEELEKASNLFTNMYDEIQAMILGGDKKSALGMIEEMKELLRSQQYRELLDSRRYQLATRTLDMYTKLANGEYESDEGKTDYIKDRYFIEYGVQPSPDEIQRIMMEGKFFGVPTRSKVKTPPIEFKVVPPQPSVVQVHPSWYNTGNPAITASGYGNAYIPK